MIRTRVALLRCLCCTLALLAYVALTPAVAHAQLAKIPDEVKNAVDIARFKPQIQQFVQAATAQLETGTPEQQKQAREALRNEVLLDGQNKATVAYINAYAQALNDQLLNLAKNPSMHVRLDAAIVLKSVAELANTSQLAPAAKQFLADQSEAVVLWAVKAARWIIPAQLSAIGGKTELLDAIIKAVQTHPTGYTGGAIAYEAYVALIMDVSPPLPAPTPAMQQAVVPAIQKLMATREQAYITGIAPSPRAEAFGSSFLANAKIWTTLPATQQMALMQNFCNLISLMSQQAASANPADRGELASTIAKISSAISIIVDPTNAGPLALKIAPARQLDPHYATPDQITNAVTAVLAAVKSAPQFSTLKDPPQASAHNAAPPPASAPTTGPVVVPGAIPMPPPAPVTPTTKPHVTTPTNQPTTPGITNTPTTPNNNTRTPPQQPRPAPPTGTRPPNRNGRY